MVWERERSSGSLRIQKTRSIGSAQKAEVKVGMEKEGLL
jgi:hypothetical protein